MSLRRKWSLKEKEQQECVSEDVKIINEQYTGRKQMMLDSTFTVLKIVGSRELKKWKIVHYAIKETIRLELTVK